ncbi:MAG: tetratricopeptide repeat protein [Promethearchaeota archaeon]
MPLLQKLDCDLKSLLTSQKQLNNLVFLAGAGISMEPPSNLPSARQIIDAILKFISPDEDTYNKLKNIKDLRFEYIIEIFRNYMDKDLKILDYFEKVTQPNIIHKFLASQMKKGNYVMTTNFDYLIEYAFGVDDPKLRVVISENDFRECVDPKETCEGGKVPLYKLHGSKKNIKTSENTKKWVISTLDALGKQKKKEGEIFTVPTYQQALFRNIARDRTLIILGYSGGDDFDIMPALRLMKNLRRIIWIEHTPDKDEDDLYKMLPITNIDQYNSLSPKDKLLQQFVKHNTEVYIIKAYTARTICKLVSKDYKEKTLQVSKKVDNISFDSFFNSISDKPSELDRLFYSGLVFYNYNQYNVALSHWKKIISIIDKMDEQNKKRKDMRDRRSAIMGNMGNIYADKGEPDKALEHHRKAYKIDEELGNKLGMATQLGNMGSIYNSKGEFDKALELYQKAYKILNQLGNLNGMATQLGNMGSIYNSKGELDKALELYQEACNIFWKLGNKQNKGSMLENIGTIYGKKGDLNKALELYQKAYEIDEELDNKEGMAQDLGNMGLIYASKGEPDKALELYQKAYKIDEELGNKLGMANQLGNMGLIYASKGEPDKALEHHRKAYKIDEELGNKLGMAQDLGNMGNIYLKQGQREKALESFTNCFILSYFSQYNRGLRFAIQNLQQFFDSPQKLEQFLKDVLNNFSNQDN